MKSSSSLIPLHEMTFYSLLDDFSERTWLHYSAFGIVQICATAELLIALVMFRDNAAVAITRILLRVLLPQCLWCVFARAGQRTYCYHDDCPILSCKSFVENDQMSRNKELNIDFVLACCFPAFAFLYLLRLVYTGRGLEELGNEYYVVIIGSLVIQTFFVNVVLALLYFESQDIVLNHSCLDVVKTRWSVLKGTVVALTSGISLTAAVRTLQNIQMMKTHSFWPVAIGTFVVVTATSRSRMLRTMSVIVSAMGIVRIDMVTSIIPHLQFIWFMGLSGLLFNVVFGGTAIKWYPRTKLVVGMALTLSTAVVLVLEISVFPISKEFSGLTLVILSLGLLGHLAIGREFM